MATTVLIADDEPILREGLSDLLSVQADFAVVGEASTFSEAVAQARTKHPDIALLSFSLALGRGEGTAAAIHDASPSTRVIVMVPPRHGGAAGTPADGVISYGASADRLIASIRAVRTDPHACDLSSGLGQRGVLTPREQQVCALLARAYSNREIQQELGICNGTVKRHVHHILLKFEAHNRTEVAVKIARSRAVAAEGAERSDRGWSW